MANKRISKFEDVSIESTQIEKSKEEKWNRISNNYMTNIKSATYIQWEEQEKEKRRKDRNVNIKGFNRKRS